MGSCCLDCGSVPNSIAFLGGKLSSPCLKSVINWFDGQAGCSTSDVN